MEKRDRVNRIEILPLSFYPHHVRHISIITRESSPSGPKFKVETVNDWHPGTKFNKLRVLELREYKFSLYYQDVPTLLIYCSHVHFTPYVPDRVSFISSLPSIIMVSPLQQNSVSSTTYTSWNIRIFTLCLPYSLIWDLRWTALKKMEVSFSGIRRPIPRQNKEKTEKPQSSRKSQRRTDRLPWTVHEDLYSPVKPLCPHPPGIKSKPEQMRNDWTTIIIGHLYTFIEVLSGMGPIKRRTWILAHESKPS